MTTIPNQGKSTEVVLLGGTGFVGRALASLLSQQGYSVTIPTRHAARHRDMALMRGVRLIGGAPAAADMANDRREESWHEVLSEHSILINLIGILNEPRHDGEGFEQAHVHATQVALKAAAKAGVKRYLHMSALGADANNGSSFYLRSKGKAEDWAHEFGDAARDRGHEFPAIGYFWSAGFISESICPIGATDARSIPASLCRCAFCPRVCRGCGGPVCDGYRSSVIHRCAH